MIFTPMDKKISIPKEHFKEQLLEDCKKKATMQKNGKYECEKTENRNVPFSNLNLQNFKELRNQLKMVFRFSSL